MVGEEQLVGESTPLLACEQQRINGQRRCAALLRVNTEASRGDPGFRIKERKDWEKAGVVKAVHMTTPCNERKSKC